MGRHRTEAAMLMILFSFIAIEGPKLCKNKLLCLSTYEKTPNKSRCAHDALNFVAAVGPKLFRKKLVNLWTYGKTPNKSRYSHDGVYF